MNAIFSPLQKGRKADKELIMKWRRKWVLRESQCEAISDSRSVWACCVHVCVCVAWQMSRGPQRIEFAPCCPERDRDARCLPIHSSYHATQKKSKTVRLCGGPMARTIGGRWAVNKGTMRSASDLSRNYAFLFAMQVYKRLRGSVLKNDGLGY